MRARALCVAAMLMFVGCGGDDSGPGGTVSTGGHDAGTGDRTCMDEDGDGFGPYCDLGNDCDDTNPEITDECVRCVKPAEGCPCDAGTEPLNCDPEDLHTTRNGVSGVLVCSEGTRYCRDEVWSTCEILFQYATFVPDK